MKKKIFAIVLALVLVFGTLTFAGCGKSDYTEYKSNDGTKVLKMYDDEFEFEMTEEQGLIKKVTKMTGDYEIDGNLYEFELDKKTTKEYFAGILAQTTTQKAGVIRGINIGDDGFCFVYNENHRVVYNDQLLFKDDKTGGAFSEYALFNKTQHELILLKDSDINEIKFQLWENIEFIKDGGYRYGDNREGVPVEITVDTSTVGETTTTVNYIGKTFVFDTLIVDSTDSLYPYGDDDKLYVYNYRVVKAGISANQWLNSLGENSLMVFVDGKRTYLDADDVSVSNWYDDDEYAFFCAQLSATVDGKEYTTKVSLTAVPENEEFIDPYYFRMTGGTCIQNFFEDQNMYSGGDKMFFVKKGNTQAELGWATRKISTFDGSFGMEYANGYSKPLTDYIDINKVGAHLIKFDEGTDYETFVRVYVYDDPKNVVATYEVGDYTFIWFDKENNRIVLDQTPFYLERIYADGSVEPVDKNTIVIEYDQNELEARNGAYGYIVMKHEIGGKEYTFTITVQISTF
ncbi:MAG: hypothetical protein E7344_01000 [Clostridiales bacterium]|nr:hypothetical protein [Clostridiales bacterium]